VRFAYAPEQGLWRVARGPEPYALREPPPPLYPGDMHDRATGNRYDSALANYRVLYFGTTREGCFGETLAPLRPDPSLASVIGDDWDGFMRLGDVPADWRRRRLAVRVTVSGRRPFLDVEAAETRGRLRTELAWVFDRLGIAECDVAAVRGGDRRLTRWISQWARQYGDQAAGQPLAGIRFLSRHNTDWECWALFDDTVVEERERTSILVQDPELQRVAQLYGLNVF
jgi:hypothetical protein